MSAQELAATVAAKRFCREALTLQWLLFRLWHRFRGDPHVREAPLARAQLIANVLPIEKRFFALAERHVNAANSDVSNLARWTRVGEVMKHPSDGARIRERRCQASRQSAH